MTDELIEELIVNLMTILSAGFIAGFVCRKLGVSLLIGYLIVGTIIGHGGLSLVTQESREIEYLARAGALLLLFAIGIEFSLEEFVRLSRFFFVGGATQMVLTAIPVAAMASIYLDWRAATVIGLAVALSSTVLVFKALAELGLTHSPHGKRAIGILLFQDVALVPLILVIPLLTGGGANAEGGSVLWLAVNSVAFVMAIVVLHAIVRQYGVSMLGALKSRELVVLFALSLLGGACWGAAKLGLPPAIGAFAAGLILSGNILSAQIDALVLPFRETFAAVFFVSLGTLLDPSVFLAEPLLLFGGLVVILAVKAAAAGLALKLTGLNWRSSLGMSLGLAQLGEFSFVLFSEALGHGLIRAHNYNRLLFIALGSLLLTPPLLRYGLKWVTARADDEHQAPPTLRNQPGAKRGLVIGAGPVGREIAHKLHARGDAVCVIDLSPVNLYEFDQQQIRTVTGDAIDPRILKLASAELANLAVVCVPHDTSAREITRSFRAANSDAEIVVRCRFESSVHSIEKAGANIVVSEAAKAAEAIMHLLDSDTALRSTNSPATL
ncbi:MAG: cation:proton antiporter [Planctomycetota bacterium]|nr:cation:proton antiporter [Planctomycetota bacterium]